LLDFIAVLHDAWVYSMYVCMYVCMYVGVCLRDHHIANTDTTRRNENVSFHI